MVSPFRRHQMKVRGIQATGAIAGATAAAPAEPQPGTAAGQEYAALRVALHEDLRKLSDVQSIEARNPMKADMAKAYAAWVDGALKAGEAGQAAQDEILVTQMIWALDYRDFGYALTLATHVLKFGLVLPERYNRTPACFVAEEIATIALDTHEAVTLEQLLRVEELIKGADMPDPALAKLHKALGRAWERKADAFDPAAENAPAGGKAAYIEEALAQCRRALELDRNVGVKKDIERLARALKAATADQE